MHKKSEVLLCYNTILINTIVPLSNYFLKKNSLFKKNERKFDSMVNFLKQVVCFSISCLYYIWPMKCIWKNAYKESTLDICTAGINIVKKEQKLTPVSLIYFGAQ